MKSPPYFSICSAVFLPLERSTLQRPLALMQAVCVRARFGVRAMVLLSYLSPSDSFMPHGYCYLWNPGLVWLHVISDGLIALAYLSIPITLLFFARKKRGLPFNWIFVCFGVFIVAGGGTHILAIWNLWHANYWIAGVLKATTALASVVTAILSV